MNSRPATYLDPAANTRRNRPTIGGGIGGLLLDGTCLLKAASETYSGSAHEFTYAPSGLRIRDRRTGANAIDKRYVYTTSGALLSVHESPSKRRDIVYANGEAIAEIDQDGNVYELHNDHLGTPRYVTNGNTSQSSKGQIIGQQAFGPYGEELVGNYNGQTLPTGYKPVTGYTGHLNEDLSGLIYMKGRYYSPLWHRFINSDQGVDPRSINQYAYVGGSPFMAKDPSGMAMHITNIHCGDGSMAVVKSLRELTKEDRAWVRDTYCGIQSETVVIGGGGEDWWASLFSMGGYYATGGGGESGGGNVRPGRKGQQENKNNDCDDGGFFDSVADSFSSIGGFFNPSNWNSDGMSSLYDLGPLGQAERISPGAYYVTAGLLGVSALAVTGAVGLEVFAPALGNATVGEFFFNITGGSKMLTGNPYLRMGWGKHDGYYRFRMATDKLGNGRKHLDIFKGPKTQCPPGSGK